MFHPLKPLRPSLSRCSQHAALALGLLHMKSLHAVRILRRLKDQQDCRRSPRFIAIRMVLCGIEQEAVSRLEVENTITNPVFYLPVQAVDELFP